jgi:hypothetical protein
MRWAVSHNSSHFSFCATLGKSEFKSTRIETRKNDHQTGKRKENVGGSRVAK